MKPLRMRAAVAMSTTALLIAGGTAALTLEPASAVPADDPTPPVPDGNSPGTGDDAYKADDPFVDHGNGPKNIPANTIIAMSFKFFPNKITVKPNQKLTFDNQDIAIHNIQTAKKPYKIKTKDAAGGEKVTFNAPKAAGKYPTVCYYHQSMLLDIIVKGKKGAKKPAAKP
jgi:plastocyanin